MHFFRIAANRITTSHWLRFVWACAKGLGFDWQLLADLSGVDSESAQNARSFRFDAPEVVVLVLTKYIAASKAEHGEHVQSIKFNSSSNFYW